MADTVTSTVLENGPKNYVIKLTNISDTTGEAAVSKIDKSTLVNANGVEPDTLKLMCAEYSIQGFSAVQILWDHTADTTAAILSGDGSMDWSWCGGVKDAGTGGLGDVLLTTLGTAVANDTYDITLKFKKV